MSRLIVKNLPKNITEKRLFETFSEKGTVTDVQLKYTKDGVFRRFAFVGFKTEEEAKAAKEYFDKSCIDIARISVEHCANLGDPSKPKSWSKYAPDSTASKLLAKSDATDVEDGKEKNKEVSEKIKEDKEKKSKKDKKSIGEVKEMINKHKDDPLFVEFMESHTGSRMIWNNDALLNDDEEDEDKEGNGSSEEESEKKDDKVPVNGDEEEEKIAEKPLTDLEYMEALKKKKSDPETKTKIEKTPKTPKQNEYFTVKVNGLAYNHKKKHVKQFFKPLKPKSIRVPLKIKGIAFVGFKTEVQMKKALLKNKSFFEGKQLFVTKYVKKEEIAPKEEDKKDDASYRWKKQEEALKSEETIAESGRIFIRNLSYTTTEDDIRNMFEKYGELTEVNLPVDRVTRKYKGFATVTFMLPEHAVKAYTELDGTVLHGRMLHLLQGKSKVTAADLLQQEDLTYKQKQELQKKATSQSSHNWNTLFLGPNTIAEAVAKKYNSTKEKLLEDSSNGLSAAVKLALGETQLVKETRDFLEENGVCLDAFNQPPEKRSKTIILVKNLPPGTRTAELRELFAKHGELGRVLMPPSGVTALIEFLEPSEARQAFSKLAYTKFKHIPLYFEWAPDNTFSTPYKRDTKKVTSSNDTNKNTKTTEQQVPAKVAVKKEAEDDEEDDPEPDTTLFVKNINFSTTDEGLKKYFEKCGRIHYANIATKKDPKVEGGKLSMGYGFVRYKLKSSADRALKTLQMTVLDGKTLELKRSERLLDADVKMTKKTTNVTTPTGTKILVRNIPFQATAEEVTQLFKSFGELKAVRLPKKFIGAEKHKGFGFVEYFTKSEAKEAFKELCQSTHLYGRRLVLEWAQTEEGIEEIRKRTAQRFQSDSTPAKRSKKSTLDPEDIGLEEENTRFNNL